MTNDHPPAPAPATATAADNPSELLVDDVEEELETAAEYHRMAAHHFELAAKHHRVAAAADDIGDDDAYSHHAYLAYRHQLNAVQYSEIAAMDNENLDGEFEKEPVQS